MKNRINKTNLNNILKALKNHQDIVDQIAKTYSSERKAFEDELESMKNKYTAEYIEETRKNYIPKINYKDAFLKSQTRTAETVKSYANKIREDIEKFYNAPVSPEFANKVNTISLSGLALTDREFDLLAKTCSSYMEARILSSLGENRENKSIYHTYNNGKIESEKVTTPDAYHLPDMVTLEECENEFESFLGHVKNFIDGYCGPGTELYEFRTCNNENVAYDRAVASTHANFFDNNYDKDLLGIIERMNKLTSGCAENKPLTEDEKQIIDEVIDPKYQALAPGEVKRLSENNETLRDMLLRDERYAKYVPVSDDL